MTANIAPFGSSLRARVRSSAFVIGALTALAATACSGSDASIDEEVDATADATADTKADTKPVEDSAKVDTAVDTGSPADAADDSTSGDAVADASPDAVADASPDAVADGGADAAPDAVADAADASPDAAVAPEYGTIGPYATTTKNATVSGQSVHCLYPTGAAPAAGFPGVAFAHGFQLANNDYDQLLGHVASYGYVVCSTNFAGSLFSMDHRDVATALTATRTAMAGGTISGLPKVDAAHIAAAGHSLGGKGSIMAVLADASFVAALALDPVDGNPSPGGSVDAAHPKLAPTQTATLKVPVGYFGTTLSHCSTGGLGSSPCAPTGLDAAALYAGTSATVAHYLWTVWDFGHMQFLDDPNCGFTCSACVAGTSSTVAARKTAIKATSVAFFERHLRGDAAAQTWLDGAKRAGNVTAKNFTDGTSALPACP